MRKVSVAYRQRSKNSSLQVKSFPEASAWPSSFLNWTWIFWTGCPPPLFCLISSNFVSLHFLHDLCKHCSRLLKNVFTSINVLFYPFLDVLEVVVLHPKHPDHACTPTAQQRTHETRISSIWGFKGTTALDSERFWEHLHPARKTYQEPVCLLQDSGAESARACACMCTHTTHTHVHKIFTVSPENTH